MGLKVCLAKPEIKYPIKKQGHAGDVGIPLGLLYLASYVHQNSDHEVKLIDYRLNKSLGNERDFDRDFYDSNIVAVGGCTSESSDLIRILSEAKKRGKIVIAGGLYPTFNAKTILDSGADFVVRGEGERTFLDLLNSINDNKDGHLVKGVSYKNGVEVINNSDNLLIENLDELPLPDYGLIDISTYAQFGPAPIYSARGCPMSCNFCTLNEMWQYKYRKRSIDNVLEEISFLRDKGFQRVHFKDETVTLNKHFAMDLFKEIERAKFGLGFKVKSRIDHLDPIILTQLMSAGVDIVHTGVESINSGSLKEMGKGITEKQIRSVFDLFNDYHCKLNPVYLLGLQNETKEHLEENMSFIIEEGSNSNVITYLSFLTPHPGTPLEKDEKLRILTKDYSRYTHKQPVAVPKVLGKEGLIFLVNIYHKIAKELNMEKYNPPISEEYVNQINSNST